MKPLCSVEGPAGYFAEGTRALPKSTLRTRCMDLSGSPSCCLQDFLSAYEAERRHTYADENKGFSQLKPQLINIKRFQVVTVVTLQACTNIIRHVMNMQRIDEDCKNPRDQGCSELRRQLTYLEDRLCRKNCLAWQQGPWGGVVSQIQQVVRASFVVSQFRQSDSILSWVLGRLSRHALPSVRLPLYSRYRHASGMHGRHQLVFAHCQFALGGRPCNIFWVLAEEPAHACLNELPRCAISLLL